MLRYIICPYIRFLRGGSQVEGSPPRFQRGVAFVRQRFHPGMDRWGGRRIVGDPVAPSLPGIPTAKARHGLQVDILPGEQAGFPQMTLGDLPPRRRVSGGEEHPGLAGFFVRHVQLGDASHGAVGHEEQPYETAGDGSMIPPSLEGDEWGGGGGDERDGKA